MIILKNIQNQEQTVEKLAGQFLLFGLLGKLLYNNPAREDLDQLAQDDVFSDAPFAADQSDVIEGLRLLQQWVSDYAANPKAVLASAQSDYTRLFMQVAGLPVAPWESVYYNEERLLFEESTIDVRRWYSRFGLEPVNVHKEPDDHIGLELLFIAHLAQQGLLAAREDNAVALRPVLEAQQEFCKQHLLRWAPLWCDLMLEHAHTDYYRGLALLTRGALTELAALLDLNIAEVARA